MSEKSITEWRESTDKGMEVGKGQPMMLDVEKAGQSEQEGHCGYKELHEELTHLVIKTAKMPTKPLIILLWGKQKLMGTLELGKKERPRRITASRGGYNQMRNLDFNLEVEKKKSRILNQEMQ